MKAPGFSKRSPFPGRADGALWVSSNPKWVGWGWRVHRDQGVGIPPLLSPPTVGLSFLPALLGTVNTRRPCLAEAKCGGGLRRAQHWWTAGGGSETWVGERHVVLALEALAWTLVGASDPGRAEPGFSFPSTLQWPHLSLSHWKETCPVWQISIASSHTQPGRPSLLSFLASPSIFIPS